MLLKALHSTFAVSLIGLLSLFVRSAFAAPVSWIPDSDGNWELPANWSSNPNLPGPSDDVTIDVGGATIRTITVGSGSQSVLSLTTQENLDIAGGGLTIGAGGGQIFGTLSMSGGTSLMASGATVTASSISAVDGAHLYANLGGTLDLSPLASYTGATNFSSVLQAQDAGSLVDLSNVTTFVGGDYYNTDVNAWYGGKVDLGNITSITSGAVYFDAYDTGSIIDLSSLTTFTDDNPSDASILAASNGATILIPNLTTLDYVDLYVGGTMSTSQITSFTNGLITVDTVMADFSGLTNLNGISFTVQTDGSADLSNVTDIDGSSVTVQTGGSADLSNATDIDRATLRAYGASTITTPSASSYTGATNFSSTLHAQDASSLVDLSNITTFVGGDYYNTDVNAWYGGKVDLSNVASITSGAVYFYAEASGSVIDLSSLTMFTDDNPSDASALHASNGATILIPNLTTLDFVDLFVGGTMSTGQITSFTNGSITVDTVTADFSGLTSINGISVTVQTGGSADLSNVTDIDRATLRAYGASTITTPSASSYTGATNFSSILHAQDASSLVDLSNITTFVGGDYYNTDVNAWYGGKVDLSNVASITSGAVYFYAEASGSVIDLSSLTTFTDDNPSDPSALYASNGATILIPNLTTLDFVDLFVGGTMSTGQITSFTNGSITVDTVTADFSGLTSINGISVTVQTGGSADLSNVTDIDRATLRAYGASTITTPSASSYTGATNFSSILHAQDASSLVDLSNITTFVGGDYYNTDVNAWYGGKVDLSNVASITSGAVYFYAEASGSVIDLSSLTTFTDDNPSDPSALYASNGATILIPNLTTLDYVDLYVGGTMSTSQITSFTNGTITVDAVANDFPGLTTFDGISLRAFYGGVLSASAATSYTGATNFSSTVEAQHADSLVDLSNLTTFVGGDYYNTDVNAWYGGKVDLSNIASITSGEVYFYTYGSDSVIDLSSLTLFTDDNPSDPSALYATNGGRIILSAGTTSIANVDVPIDTTGGVIEVGTLELLEGSILHGYGEFASGIQNSGGHVRADSSTLTLSGAFSQSDGWATAADGAVLRFGATGTANVTIVGGEVGGKGTIDVGTLTLAGGRTNPGDSAGQVTIDGDLTFQSGARAFFELGGTTPVTEHDVLNVIGTATLAGELDGEFIHGYQIGQDMTETFTLVTAGAVTEEFDTQIGDHVFGCVFLDDIQYNPTDVIVTYYQAVPGDFDGDRDVDGDDFLTWQGGFGETTGAEWTGGDSDDDGDVDGDDFLAWQSNFGFVGSGSAATAPVPEPTGFIVAIFALLATLTIRSFAAARGR